MLQIFYLYYFITKNSIIFEYAVCNVTYFILHCYLPMLYTVSSEYCDLVEYLFHYREAPNNRKLSFREF